MICEICEGLVGPPDHDANGDCIVPQTRNRNVFDLVAGGGRVRSDSDTYTTDDLVWFEHPRADIESLARTRWYVIDRKTFEELGSPTWITVTVELT